MSSDDWEKSKEHDEEELRQILQAQNAYFMDKVFAAIVLVKQGQTHEAILPVLLEALTAIDQDMRSAAALTLGKLGVESCEAVPHLIKALKKEDHQEVRYSLALALASIGAPAVEAVPALIPLTQDDHLMVQYAAILALGQIGADAEAARTTLQALTAHDNSLIRHYARQALAAIQSLPTV